MNKPRVIFLIVMLLASRSLLSVEDPPVKMIEDELGKLSGQKESVQRRIDESRLLYYLARYTADVEKKKTHLQNGMNAADLVIQKEPTNPGALFWWTANQGEMAQTKGKLAALPVLEPMEQTLLKLKSIDPNYWYFGADRVLGRIYQKAPSFISIGSSKKAREHLTEAFRKAPAYPGNALFLADFLADEGEKAEARKLAESILTSPNLSKFPIERSDWLGMVKDIMERTKGAGERGLASQPS